MKEDFVIRKNFGIARYHRTASEAFKGADYANPYSYFKKDYGGLMARLLGFSLSVIGLTFVGLAIWSFYHE